MHDILLICLLSLGLNAWLLVWHFKKNRIQDEDLKRGN